MSLVDFTVVQIGGPRALGSGQRRLAKPAGEVLA